MYSLDYSKKYFHSNSLRNTIIFRLPNLFTCSTKLKTRFFTSQFKIRSNEFGPTGRLACEKNIFHMHAIKKLGKGIHIEIENYFQIMFHFYNSLYGLWAYIEWLVGAYYLLNFLKTDIMTSLKNFWKLLPPN